MKIDKHQKNDPNPGAMHLILNYAFAEKKQGLVADTDPMSPVWNRPIYGFESREISNRPIKGKGRIVELKTKIFYIKEVETPKVGIIQRAKAVNYKELHYFIDLNSKGEIIGGSWVNKSDRLDFIWSPFFNRVNDYSVDKFFNKNLMDKLTL